LATACIAIVCAAVGHDEFAHSVRPELISFTNGRVVLRGLLLTPQPPTSDATVIMVHGSGPATRDSFGGLEQLLVRRGIPVLIYDKRGVQDSTGDWQTASLEDLATDVLAAVKFLKRRGIARIGLWGGSQGGWIVPVVAARSKDVDFIISVAGSGVTPAEQELFRQEKQWHAAGLSASHIAQLRSAWRRFYNYASTGHGAKELDREIAEIEKIKVLDDRRPQKSAELPVDALVRHLGFNFDPLPSWERVRCPVLAIWGERDNLVPVRRSADLISHTLTRTRHTDHTFRIFPGAQHGLAMSDTPKRLPDGTSQTDWAPGYIELLARWIKERSSNPLNHSARAPADKST
jgi:pimeloyl-ACP methyl ester carboxylesterase